MKYESPITYHSKAMPNVKVLKSRSQVKVKVTRSKIWYQWKGLVTRNTRVKYESPITYNSKVMVKVTVFFADKQTDKWTDQKIYAPKSPITGT